MNFYRKRKRRKGSIRADLSLGPDPAPSRENQGDIEANFEEKYYVLLLSMAANQANYLLRFSISSKLEISKQKNN